MNRSLPYIVLLIGVFIWCVALFLPPMIAAWEAPSTQVSHYFYKCFALICHQYDSRSLHLFGYKLAVCSRCTAIYFGFFFGVVLFPLISKKIHEFSNWWLGLAALPMVLDVGLEFVSMHHSTLFIRIFSGSLFGVVAALVLTPIFIEAFSEFISQYNQSQGVHYESKT